MLRKRISLGLLAAGGLIMLGAVACGNGVTAGQVETANVTRGNIVQHVTADGRLAFVDYRNLTFGTTGRIAQINVSELDKVTKGQVLAKLDTTPLEQAVKAAELGIKTVEMAQKSAQMDRTQAEYAVKSAEADLAHVQETVKAAGIDLDAATDNFRKITYPYTYSTFTYDVPQALGFIGQANDQINAAVAGLQPGLTAEQYYAVTRQLQDALDQLTKGQQLLSRGQGQDVFASGLLTVKDFWTLRAAQMAMDKAQLVVQDSQGLTGKAALAIDSSRTALNKAQVGIDKANNDMEIARNNLNIANTNLANAVITAPFNGVMASVSAKVGDVMSAVNYTTPAMTIIDPTRLELDIRVSEADIPSVKAGQKVAIGVDALPEDRFEGTVSSISPLPVTAGNAVSYVVKAILSVAADSPLKAGMAATVDITASQRSNVLLLPVRAVQKDGQGKPVARVLVNGQTQVTPVVTGMTDGRYTEIVSGLAEGQTVVAGRTDISLYDGPR